MMPFSSSNPLSFASAWGVPTSVTLLLGALLILCLALVVGRGRRKPGFDPADYRAKALLSPWEVKALAEIQADLPRGYHVCPQVRLADAVQIVQRDPALRRAALNRVAKKSVDFAIIDGQGRIVLVSNSTTAAMTDPTGVAGTSWSMPSLAAAPFPSSTSSRASA